MATHPLLDLSPHAHIPFTPGAHISNNPDNMGWIMVFLVNMVEALEVDTKLNRAIFFLNEEDQRSMGRTRGTDEPCSKVHINELMESCKFLLGQGVNGTIRQ